MRFLKKIALNFWHTKNLKIKLWVVGWKNWWNNCLSKCVKIILTRLHQKNVKKVKSWKFSAEWEWSTAEKYPIFSTFYISRTKGCQKKLISCHKVLKKCYNNTKISGQSENFSAVLHQGLYLCAVLCARFKYLLNERQENCFLPLIFILRLFLPSKLTVKRWRHYAKGEFFFVNYNSFYCHR